MVHRPFAAGVNVAVYTVVDVAAKLERVPFVTVTSPTTKLLVASDAVKLRSMEASLVVLSRVIPDVMAMVGCVTS